MRKCKLRIIYRVSLAATSHGTHCWGGQDLPSKVTHSHGMHWTGWVQTFWKKIILVEDRTTPNRLGRAGRACLNHQDSSLQRVPPSKTSGTPWNPNLYLKIWINKEEWSWLIFRCGETPTFSYLFYSLIQHSLTTLPTRTHPKALSGILIDE